jgi:hypothetical protein
MSKQEQSHMDKITYSLLVGLVAFTISAILSYLIEGKINLIPTLGPAIGVTLVAYFLWPK